MASRARWRQHFEKQSEGAASGIELVRESLAAHAAEFERLRDGSADRELLRRHAQVTLGVAEFQHGVTVKRLEALINLAALESRSGRQERAEAVHARFVHHAHASKAVVDLWADRLRQLGGYRDLSGAPVQSQIIQQP